MFSPIACRLVVAHEVFLFRSFEHSDVKVFRVEFQYVYEIFPRHVDSTFLKVVAEAPVAEHFKHGVMVSVVSHLFEVVMLSAHTETLLRVGTPAWFRVACTEYNIFPLVHTSVGEHKRRVVLNNHRSRRYDCMSFRFEIVLKRIADFISCHHCFLCLIIFFSENCCKVTLFFVHLQAN